ncbi:phosphoenolpyruvate--protein phosphotransferase [Pseudogulbenkiania ferrooxidans]|uniref:phosphoenolpyruvate--protein phosphotransferase n=1 Tax=Pseudogulbenkiania ferrooxidans 2002 TaxID=279714 RepID=B9Z755_9NEIS|nr:phosphoenolpyruvate--protein phosphotransferase [Pseudogulbenkiania ferrooxidans]EEG07370.1 phosphoenolpyruvate-protein phosphotransferase [Pseudogulbenkiania ferrooxidans 2002]
MPLPLIPAELVRLGASPADKNGAIAEAGHLLASAGYIDPAYIDSLLRRETVANTFLGHGVAIPHGMIEDRYLIRHTGVAVLQIPGGLEWNPGQRVHLVVAIAAQSDEHITLLRRLTRLLQDEKQLQTLFGTNDPAPLLAALGEDAVVAEAAVATVADHEHHFSWTMEYPNGLHARPATLWVETARRFDADVLVRNHQESADCKNLIGLLQLGLQHGHELHVSASGPEAEQALATLRDVMTRITAQEQADAAAAALKQKNANRQGWAPAGALPSIGGISASPGLAIGTTRQLRAHAVDVKDRPGQLIDGGAELEAALVATRDELEELALDTARRLGTAEAGIFRAQAELLNDSELITLTCRFMVQQHGVAWAWHQAVEQQAGKLAALGSPLLAARAADLRDVGRRVLAKLDPSADTGSNGVNGNGETILIAADLAPSDTATLDVTRTLGLCTAQGGPTSHTAILARTLGLPALVAGGAALLDVPDGTTVILDGHGGRLYLDPSAEDLASARRWLAEQQERDARQAADRALPAQTRDGHRVEIAANVNRPEKVAEALTAGAEGVGLMRTEFLFLERDSAPDEEEQYATYRAMIEALQGRTLIIRALDIGGDKQVPYLDLPREENPFLGVRGARLQLRRADLLEPQLRALYRAAAHGPMSIMFPMVTSLDEVRTLRAHCERIRQELNAPQVPLGIMVEVPAVATMADRLAEHVDFFSIGTNDLTQYVLAIDRQHPELAREADSLHPAVLRLIQQTVDGARRHQVWVGVCGGLAGDPLGAAILTGIGVHELSMSPRDIPAVKARLRAATHSTLLELARQALECDSAADVRALEGDVA